MSVPYEKAVAEDLNVGHGPVTVTNPNGGTMAGNKISLGRLITPYSLTFAASLTIDPVNGDFQTVTLTANVTDSAITFSAGSAFSGELLFLQIIQNATGGWTFNWPTNVLSSGSYPISTTANDRTLVTLIYNGSNWMFLCAPTVSQ